MLLLNSYRHSAQLTKVVAHVSQAVAANILLTVVAPKFCDWVPNRDGRSSVSPNFGRIIRPYYSARLSNVVLFCPTSVLSSVDFLPRTMYNVVLPNIYRHRLLCGPGLLSYITSVTDRRHIYAKCCVSQCGINAKLLEAMKQWRIFIVSKRSKNIYIALITKSHKVLCSLVQ